MGIQNISSVAVDFTFPWQMALAYLETFLLMFATDLVECWPHLPQLHRAPAELVERSCNMCDFPPESCFSPHFIKNDASRSTPFGASVVHVSPFPHRFHLPDAPDQRSPEHFDHAVDVSRATGIHTAAVTV